MAAPFSKTQLKGFRKSLKETSVDSENEAELVSYRDIVYDFDAIAKEVCHKYTSETYSSCDALYLNNGKYYLIEFKNQGRTSVKKDVLKKKAFDSIAVLQSTFCWSESRETLKDRMVLVVVFNGGLEERESYIKFENKLLSLAKTEREPILFDLGNFKDWYSEIYTLDKSEFEKSLYPQIFDSH